MLAVHTSDELRAADQAAIAHVGLDRLLERAGRAVATAAVALVGEPYGLRIVVVAGPGHNGDDGRVAARLLARRGARTIALSPGTALERSGDLEEADLVVDAAFGTGFRGRYLAPRLGERTRVLAVDVPSGLDGDTGAAEDGSVRATRTVTMAALKPGLLMGRGPELAGRVEVAAIGIPVAPGLLGLVEDADVANWLEVRGRNAHKWLSACVVVAGSPGMFGAARLCSSAAMRAGSGMVRLVVPGAVASELPVTEAVARGAPAGDFAATVLDEAARCRSLVVGPGLGTSADAAASVRTVVAGARVPVVVDADGLSALGRAEDLRSLIEHREDPSTPIRAPVGTRGRTGAPPGSGGPEGPGSAGGASIVLTPHDGEYARLAGYPPTDDRLASARSLAARSGAVVVLKGATTVVADPSGRALFVTSGSPRLATAGTGDVLAGMIGAFLARGLDPFRAAALAGHVHGRAASLGFGDGLVAGDLPDLVARALTGLRG